VNCNGRKRVGPSSAQKENWSRRVLSYVVKGGKRDRTRGRKRASESMKEPRVRENENKNTVSRLNLSEGQQKKQVQRPGGGFVGFLE